MSHYERRLAADKEEIRRRLAEVGDRVEEAIGGAVEALLTGDRGAASELILADLPINRETRAIDAICHAFVARHLPSAGHLRFVSSALRLTVILERIGDYAVTIAREAVQLTEPVPESVAGDIRRLSGESRDMLSQALRAFSGRDPELARETKPLGKVVGRTYDQMVRELLSLSEARPLKDLFALQSVYNKLDRVSDQAKNLCEETLFEVLGETKPPKIYRVLFVDARDTILGPLAVALARKAFSNSGRFESAGWQPGDAPATDLVNLAADMGLDLDPPSKLTTSRDALARHHVIVGLAPGTRARLPELPYQTALLEWSLPSLDGAESVRLGLQQIMQDLSNRITELMITLRGEEAS